MKVNVSEIVSLTNSDLYSPLVIVTFEHPPTINASMIAVRFSKVRQVYSSGQQTSATSAAESLSNPSALADAPVAWNIWISPEADDPEAVRRQIIAVANAIANA